MSIATIIGEVYIRDATVEKNHAAKGGAISSRGAAWLDMRDSRIRRNTAGTGAPGVLSTSVTDTVCLHTG